MVRARIAPAVLIAMIPALTAGPAIGDYWQPEDGHKMHFPQEGDLDTGVAVYDMAPTRLADDWQCSESGAVTDIHIWVSWKNDQDTSIGGADIAIRSDSGTEPGGELWSRSFDGENIGYWVWSSSPDGLWWYDPTTGNAEEDDHTALVMLSFSIGAQDAFTQTEGARYWLDVSLELDEQAAEQLGWSNTNDSYRNGAVWWDDQDSTWRRLSYPSGHPEAQNEDDQMDLAFVIVPEPATIALLALGAGATVLRRRRRG
ncbi:MAG: PEP-CTERM sorting domain-containing protein [Phycisphaerae bacterium]